MTATRRHPSLRHDPCDLIDGDYISLAGEELCSHNPARPAETVWAGSPNIDHVDRAVAAARKALPIWSRLSMDKRIEALRAYQEVCRSRVDEITALIQDEVGKANWEAKLEAGALAGKVDITLDDAATGGLRRVTDFEFALTDTRQGVCRFRPHGVMAVLGPFNFPAHLPNGHMVPALLMGNTIVLKPSDKTPAMGQLLGELFDEALSSVGAPTGVVNVVQGAVEPAVRLVNHDDIDGILFTGSWAVGKRILEANLDRPGRIVALEMGGNNPAIVMDDANLRQAVLECARAAFNTTGQRCTSTRRILVHEKIADQFIDALVKTASALKIGAPDVDPPVFLGPIIDEDARQATLRFVDDLKQAGGEVLLAPRALDDVPNGAGGHFVSPGVVRVDRFTRSCEGAGRDAGCDVEVFGPVVRIAVVSSYDDAIEQANATRYGLSASIFTQRSDLIERFLVESKAGCVNVNTGTAGASGKMPFGGVGISGNHRPAGSFSVDYCSYPVASMVEQSSTATPSVGMPFEESWIS
jgi:succinylglutamic semialdehyde dehydrogenase